MRIFKTRYFDKFARKNHISDQDLLNAVLRAEQGLIDADLGGKIIKQRIARKGQGRSGGFRTLILYRLNENSYFIAGFSKKDKENIDAQEENALRLLVRRFALFSAQEIEEQVKAGVLIEILRG